jgi:hypothetical protein
MPRAVGRDPESSLRDPWETRSDTIPSRPTAPACRYIARSLSPSMCSDSWMPLLLLRSDRALASLLLHYRAETPSSHNVPKWSRPMSSHSELRPGLTKDSHLSMLSPGRRISLKESQADEKKRLAAQIKVMIADFDRMANGAVRTTAASELAVGARAALRRP